MAVVRCTFTMMLLGQFMQNQLHFDNVNNALTHLQIKDHLVANWITPLKAAQVTTLTYNALRIRDLEVNPPASTEFPLGQIPGTGSATGMLTVGCFVIQLKSFGVGRRSRGRFYLAGPRADWTQNNVINASGVAGMAPILASLENTYVGVGKAPLQLIIRPKDNNFPDVIVMDLNLSDTLGIQRRRNIGVGM